MLFVDGHQKFERSSPQLWLRSDGGEGFSGRALKRDSVFLEELVHSFEGMMLQHALLCPFSLSLVPPPSSLILPRGKQIQPHHPGLLLLKP